MWLKSVWWRLIKRDALLQATGSYLSVTEVCTAVYSETGFFCKQHRSPDSCYQVIVIVLTGPLL